MICLKENKDCCGCNACVQSCPKSCIVMQEDKEGFLYPVVDTTVCIDCGLCENVCPVINQGEARKPLHVYAAKNKNEEIRMQSSSGGIFTLLAEQTLSEEGVVFGARFNDDWEVIHDYTETVEGLAAFRGSKYVQSRIGETFKQAEHFLKTGRKVLFSGTPCQIAGLKLFLRKEYENLFTVDFICHGVPSPLVWRTYLEELLAREGGRKNSVLSHSNPPFLNSIRDISRIEFRNKALGWKKYSFALTLSVLDRHGAKNTVLLSEPLNKNVFLRGFLADLYLRPSCYACPSKCLKSGSDITIGDFWGIQNVMPEFDDDKGVSLEMLNTVKSLAHSEKPQIEYKEMNYLQGLNSNFSIEKSAKLNKNRHLFWEQFDNNCLFELILKQTKKRSKNKVKCFFVKFLVSIHALSIAKKLYR